MKSRLATYLTSIIIAMVIILSSGFDVYAETYDTETEIELAESISPISAQENVKRPKAVENKQNGKNTLIKCNRDERHIIEHNASTVSIHKIICNYRE